MPFRDDVYCEFDDEKAWPGQAFKMVEIGAGNAELGRHLALVEPTLAAQTLQASAEKELALQHVGKSVKLHTKAQV